MSAANDVRRCTVICDRLEQIMTETGVTGFLPSVQAMRTACDVRPPRRALQEVASIRRSINGGMGSYNDIVFWWDDDRPRTVAVNHEWQALNDELWGLITTG